MIIHSYMRKHYQNTTWYQWLYNVHQAIRTIVFNTCKTRRKRLFYSSLTQNMTGNPGALCRYLQTINGNQYEHILFSSKADKDIAANGMLCTSWEKAYWLRPTASCTIEDTGPWWLKTKRVQLNINTWHGGGYYKKVNGRVFNLDHVDVFLSSSVTFSKMLRDEWGYKGFILPSGLPRNDILFNGNHQEIKNKVVNLLSLPVDSHIILYAPTWRDRKKNSITYPDFDILKKTYA